MNMHHTYITNFCLETDLPWFVLDNMYVCKGIFRTKQNCIRTMQRTKEKGNYNKLCLVHVIFLDHFSSSPCQYKLLT